MLNTQTTDSPELKKNKEEVSPRYDLSPEEINALEGEVVAKVEEQFEKEGIYAVWISPESKYANILRTYEAEYFPEVKDVVAEVEEDTVFLALVDTRTDSRRIVHATTLSAMSDEAKELAEPETTGFYTVDDLIEMKNFTAREFLDYYAAKGVDMNSCISVDTNFKIGERAPKFNGLDTAQLAYVTVFNFVQKRATETSLHEREKKFAVFASINLPSIISFKRMGIECEPMMGRDDLITSESMRGLKYTPVAIISNENAIELFQTLNLNVPETSID